MWPPLQVDLVNKLGPFAWLAAAVAFAETLVCIKVQCLCQNSLAAISILLLLSITIR